MRKVLDKADGVGLKTHLPLRGPEKEKALDSGKKLFIMPISRICSLKTK
jgi:hypothetical protein